MVSLPLVSVVIPYFNREATLARALLSVQSQSYEAIEIIVVDDASRASPNELISTLNLTRSVTVVRQDQNCGQSAARNRGTEFARGEFVAFLDSDDEWTETKIEKQVKAASASEDPGMVFCASRVCIHTTGGRVMSEVWNPAHETLGEFLFISCGKLQTSSFLVAKSLAKKVPFNESLRQYEDYLYVLKLMASGALFVPVEDAVSIWYRDGRKDQLSNESGKIPLDQGSRFIELAAGLLKEREVLAFRVRWLGPALIKRNPALVIKEMALAWSRGIVSTRGVLGMVYRAFVKSHILRWRACLKFSSKAIM